MKWSVVAPLAAIAISAFAAAAGAAPSDPSAGPAAGMERMQRWTADREALLAAKLAGLKAGLKLTPDQEKLWGPFEAAVRDAAQMRMERMQAMMERMHNNMPDMMKGEEGDSRSPVDRLEAMADRLSQGAAALKKIADAAKPLYAGLDNSQKHVFGWLGRELVMMGHEPHGMGMMGPGMMGSHGSDETDHLRHRHDDKSDDQ